MLRRTKALVASELPPKVETVMRVELTGRAGRFVRNHPPGHGKRRCAKPCIPRAWPNRRSRSWMRCCKLRRGLLRPAPGAAGVCPQVRRSAKMAEFMELRPEMLAEGRRVLLFPQFTSMLGFIEAELQARGLPWVEPPAKAKNAMRSFSALSGEVPLFLISLKAGGVGAEPAPGADTVIHYDPCGDPTAEAQATDRAHRIGQTQNLWVVKMVAQGTIEERILALPRSARQAGPSPSTGAKRPAVNRCSPRATSSSCCSPWAAD